MRSFSKILLPVDFSERSVGAARYAQSLARHFQAELVVLHVLTPPNYEFGALEIAGSMLDELYRNRAEQASKELDAFITAELAGLKVRRMVLEGDPAKKIVDLARDEAADIITMPTHGYGPFRRFILGSNTAKVLHDADCPVWTGVHLEVVPALASLPFRSILCAVDLGPQSPKTLDWAAWLARQFGARLGVVHATAGVPDLGDGPKWQWRTDTRAAAGRELFRLLDAVGAEADLSIEAGEPAQVICSVAARAAADVLVIGRGSAAGVFGRLRTNAYAIIRQSPCPVVSV
ncbi:MAG: universal stress protein [Bryobacteraceae bacterium]|jgi:nucleotide-binding universal stress UspA family protein